MDALFIEEMQNPYLQVAEGVKTEGKTLSDTQRLNGLLDDLEISLASDRTLFAHVHFMGSHGPVFNPPHREFSRGLVQAQKWMEPFYFDSVLDFDAKLATIYHKLRAKGQLDNTVLVVTSDHGQRHSMEKRIPLLIRLPGGEMAGRYRANVQLTDIAPTLLEYLAIPKPQWMRGFSLLDAGEIPPDRFILSATSGKRGPNEQGKWVRLETGNFQKANKFQVIYCDRFVNIAFPDPRPSVKQLPGNTSPNDCMNTPVGELARLAIAALKPHFED
jgi:arylsulfatase A-like enzyme